MAATTKKLNLLSLSKPQLTSFFKSLGKPKYRADQLWTYLYNRGPVSGAAPSDALPPLAIQDITTFSKADRAALASEFDLDMGEITSVAISKDGTKKLVVSVPSDSPGGRHSVECVFIPRADANDQDDDQANEGEDAGVSVLPGERSTGGVVKGTLCVSSQAGCSLSCSFCHTGTQALEGNLPAAAIVSQYLLVSNYLRSLGNNERISNIVYMGQGEPLYNWRSVKRSIEILTDSTGLAMPAQRLTLSTSGIAPLIPALADYRSSGVPVGLRLALSLHAPNNELRSKIMGINRQYPLEQVMEACALFLTRKLQYNQRLEAQASEKRVPESKAASSSSSPTPSSLLHSDDTQLATSPLPVDELTRLQQRYGEKHGSSKHRSRITMEYVLLKGTNDSPAHADQLKQLLARYLPYDSCHVNLLPFHPWKGSPYEPPTESSMLEFQDCLGTPGPRGKRLQVHIRKSRGLDIAGACGQLRSSEVLKKAAQPSTAASQQPTVEEVQLA